MALKQFELSERKSLLDHLYHLEDVWPDVGHVVGGNACPAPGAPRNLKAKTTGAKQRLSG